MQTKQLDPHAVYDEIGGQLREGDTIQIKEFKPPFVLAKIGKIEAPEKGADNGFVEIQLVPMSLPAFMGKMHNGIVRVVDPASEATLNQALDRAGSTPPGAPRTGLRSVTKFDEQGKQQ